MNKQKLSNLFVLSLLFALGIIYGAQVYVSYSRPLAAIEVSNLNDDTTESSEENVKESAPLFIHEKLLYHLKPLVIPTGNLKAYIHLKLPDTHLSLNTPPPDYV